MEFEDNRQEIADKLQTIGSSILSAARDELYLGMRFLDVALSSFVYRMDGSVSPFGTDGAVIYFEPRRLGGLYRENRILVNRGYLHMVFHCIFRHFEMKMQSVASSQSDSVGMMREVVTADKQTMDGMAQEDMYRTSVDRIIRIGEVGITDNACRMSQEGSGQAAVNKAARYMDLSCDIAVEHLIDGLYHRSVRYSRSLLRRETYRLLEAEGKTLNAQRVYKILMSWNLEEKELQRLEQEFYTDDHKYWQSKKPDQKRNPLMSRKWAEINDGIETDLETFSKEAGEKDGDFLEQIRAENRTRCDYREFLRKFAVFREEMEVDDDTFDYNFYTYGLRLYGNMPLIEPQETKEIKKVEEFVIVIDTSMSCSGELVKKFLSETYGILSESESFFKKVNVHIIQCDEKVHKDKKITSGDELKDYMENLELFGDGGTDFRPAFEYVEGLLLQHEFNNLKGLLYFTDGFGIYPNKRPAYRTAFVFMQEDYRDVDVPPWAIKLIIEEEDLQSFK